MASIRTLGSLNTSIRHRFAATVLSCSVPLAAVGPTLAEPPPIKEIMLPGSALRVTIEQSGPPNSDVVSLRVRIHDRTGGTVVRLPPLVGPVHVSATNSQILDCEENSTRRTHTAKAFGLDGKQHFEFSHRGFLRRCGTTEDERLYWFQYDVMKSGLRTAILVVLNSQGTIVSEAETDVAIQHKFSADGHSYSLTISTPEIPG